MLSSPEQALAFVRKHGIVTMTRTSSRRSLVEAVAGVPVQGSWWGHPRGKVIYRLAEALHDSDEVLSLKLVDGKVTFLHRSLWPALARVVTDPDWRKATTRKIGSAARNALREVELKGSVSPGLKELERSLLVHGGSVHTEKGSHTTVLSSWRRVFDAETLVRARHLTLVEALSLLRLSSVP